jgi:hypothetical protein
MVANLVLKLPIAAPRTIRRQVTGGGIRVTPTIEQAIGKRAKNRFGMLPAHALERAPAIGNVNGFVPDIAKVARAVFDKEFKYLVR